MEEEEIIKTGVWELYERSRNFCNLTNMFYKTDLCYRMYNDDQWNGVKLKNVEPVQLNYIKPIVKYKVGVINDNLYAVNFSSENYDKQIRKEYEKICQMLNKFSARMWEKDKMDYKLRLISKDSAITSEGIMWCYWNSKEKMPVTEILNKTDVFYGNENEMDIQKQPYIIIKRRISVLEAQNKAKEVGLPREEIENIIGDSDFYEQAGDDAKIEKDEMVTVLTKLYKKDGKVHFDEATKLVEFQKDVNTGMELYQLAHFVWEEKKGSARGQGEVLMQVPNQIEVNKNLMRILLTTKNTAFPIRVVNDQKIMNPTSAENVGALLKTRGGMTVDDVRKLFAIIEPAKMSSDVRELQNDLITISRELAGAGDIATGEVNPETASGKAILAVQQASQSPLTEQKVSLKNFVEDIAKIWLEMFMVYSDKVELEDEVENENGETEINIVKIRKEVLRKMKLLLKIDVTPISEFDKYAQELSLENMLKAGYFNIQKLSELKIYVKLLPDNSAMPKQKLEEAIELMEKEQQRIAMINQQAQIMMQRANQFLNSDEDSQAEQISELSRNEQLNNQEIV